jgi:hypothetical protein
VILTAGQGIALISDMPSSAAMELLYKYIWSIPYAICMYIVGVAQSVDRSIALLFHDRGSRRE